MIPSHQPSSSITRHPVRWLPCNSLHLNNSSISSSDKIAIHFQKTPNNNSTHTQPFQSELPPQELLNLSLASRNSPGARFTATIPAYDSPSFVTDHHKRWLTQPQSPRLPPTTSDFSHDQEADFVLFPTPTDHRLARIKTERALATSRTAPNLRIGSAYHGQQQQQQHRRQSPQQASSASPIQNPRVSDLIQDTGSVASSTSLQQSTPTGQQQHFYASSAPSSSTALLQQQFPRTRPPVPLFTCNSTGNLQDQQATNMSHSTFPEGRVTREPSNLPILTTPLLRFPI